MNIWQIEMERSPYSNTLLFNRNTKLSLSIGLLLLFPALVQGADSLYDQQILQARQGQYAPFLSYLQQYQLRHALTPSQVADWLQVALWAGQDDEVVKVWRRYQVYMPLPARGTAATGDHRHHGEVDVQYRGGADDQCRDRAGGAQFAAGVVG